MTLYENSITIAVGVVLIAASVFAKGISYGMPSHRQRPVFPATRAVRVVLLSVGLLSLAVGLIGVLRG